MRFIDWVRNHPAPAPCRSFVPRSTRRYRDFNRILLRLELLEERATPAILTVNSLLDNSIPGDGLVTLREAIQAHNNGTTTDLGQTATGNDTIDLRALNGTITLTQGELAVNFFTSGSFTTSLDLLGSGASQLTISGGNTSRVFNNTQTTSTLILRDLTISDGISTDSAGGAGILNVGTLFTERCVITNNIYLGTALAFGAGINNLSGANLTLSQTLVSNNFGAASGVIFGAGVASAGNLNLQNCTFTGNSADDSGGAIYLGGGVAMLTNNTIIANRANNDNIGSGPGGGLFIVAGTSVILRNNIIALNTGINGTDDDVSGMVDATSANNLIGVNSGLAGIGNGTNGNLIGDPTLPINPLVAPLANYGGPTPNYALLPGSLALDTGGNFGLNFDQRGVPRNNLTDIGAFESSGFSLVPASGSTPQSALIENPFPNPLALQVVPNNALEPVAGGFIQVIPMTDPNGAGAGAAFTGPSPIDTNGMTSFNAFANSIPGTYSILAAVDFSSPPALFVLTNVGIITQLFPASGSTNPTVFGNPFSVAARAQGTDGTPVSGGQIDVFFDGSYLGTVQGSPGMPLPVPQNLLTIGTHIITAVYVSGSESTIAGSESSLVLVVQRAPTQTSITVDPSATNLGSPVRIFGTVKTLNSSTPPSGTVALMVNGVEVARATLVTGETDSSYEFLTSALPVGVNVLRVRYDGDAVSDVSLSDLAAALINGPALISPIGNQLAVEGIANAFNLGSFIDPGSPGPFTVRVDWGDGTVPTTFVVATPGPLGNQTHIFADNGVYTVTVTVDDGSLISGPRTFTVLVTNVAPRLIEPLRERFTLTDSREFTLDGLLVFDPGIRDSIRVIIDWGDGSDPTIIDLGPDEREISPDLLDHTFPPGNRTYRVTITLIDKDGEVTRVETTVAIQLPRPNDDVISGNGFTNDNLNFFDGDELDDDENDDGDFSDDEDFFAEDPNDEDDDDGDDFDDEDLSDDAPAITFRGAEVIRLKLPRFGPPIGRERREPRREIPAPTAPLPGLSRVGDTPPPTSPLNEKSPLGTPLNLFNSVFDSDDSVNLIDSLRRELSKPKPSISTPSLGNDPGTGGPMSYLNPMTDGELPGNRPSWMTPLILGTFGAMWWKANRRGRRGRGRKDC